MTGRIVNVRGTNGSGKSYIVHRILDAHPGTPVIGEHEHPKARARRPGPRLLGYEVKAPGTLAWPVFVVGAYDVVCGGADGIPTHDEIQILVRRFAARGHVLFESVTVSNVFARWAAMAREEFPGGRMVFAYMDTPAAVCEERVRARRAERRGGTPPSLFGEAATPVDEWDAHQLHRKYRYTGNTRRAMLDAGLAVVDLDHTDPRPEERVLGLFREWERAHDVDRT